MGLFRNSVFMVVLIFLFSFVVIACADSGGQTDGDSDINCQNDSECPDGMFCNDDKICESIATDGDNECLEDNDCTGNQVCENHKCVDPADGDETDSSLDGDFDNDFDGENDGTSEIEEEQISGERMIEVPALLNFAPLLDNESANKSFEISSIGTGRLKINSIEFASGSSADFSLSDLPQSFPVFIEPGETLSVTVNYNQTMVGYDEGSVKILSDAQNLPLATVLVNSLHTGTPNIECLPESLDFGIAPIGENGLIKIITCTNKRTNDEDSNLLELWGFEFFPPQNNVFDVGENVANKLFIKSGESVDIELVFNPTIVGNYLATFKMFHNSGTVASPLGIDLLGEGGIKSIEVTPETVNFGKVQLTETEKFWVTLQNNGDTDVIFKGIQKGAGFPNKFDFDLHNLLDDGDLLIQAGDNIQFEALFTPTSTDLLNAQARVLTDMQDISSSYFDIVGAGSNFLVTATPPEYDFAAVLLDDYVGLTITVSNDGESFVEIESAELADPDDGFVLVPVGFPIELDPGDSTQFEVYFSPVSEVQYETSVIFGLSNDLEPTLEVPIKGLGALKYLTIEPDELDVEFGDVVIGTEKTVAIRLINSGNLPVSILDAGWSSSENDPYNLLSFESFAELVIEPQTEKTLSFAFNPPIAGIDDDFPYAVDRDFTLVTDSENNSELDFYVSATAINPIVSVNPAGPVYIFGNQPPGYEADPIVVTLTNGGTGELVINDIHLTLETHGYFRLEGLPDSFPITLQPSFAKEKTDQLQFALHYFPEVYGNHTGMLRIVNEGYADKNWTVDISATSGNCGTGLHKCDGSCVSDNDPAHCGSQCDPCQAPDNGQAACVEWLSYYRCDFECDENYEKQGELCVPMSADDCCGIDCTDCTLNSSDNGDWLCNPQTSTCELDCDPFYHDNEGQCESNNSADCCGAFCETCAAYQDSVGACVGEEGNTDCSIECVGDFGNCNGYILDGCEVNLDLSIQHCGECDDECNPDNANPVCADGICEIDDCKYGYKDCNLGVFDGCEIAIKSDTDNCSDCDVVCTVTNGTPYCQNFECKIESCNEDYRNCDSDLSDCETNITSNKRHCGACDAICNLPNADAECVDSECAIGECDEDFMHCNSNILDGCETNIKEDELNCGSCNELCDPDHSIGFCDDGECTISSCTDPYLNCNTFLNDGCEVNKETNPEHCGGCGQACSYNNANSVCIIGNCAMGACYENYLNCENGDTDGCEVNKLTSNIHCGECNSPCINPDHVHGTSCGGGVCNYGSCDTGWLDCYNDMLDGCETPLGTTDNCASCGDSCSFDNAEALCIDGECRLGECNQGFENCNSDEFDGCETDFSQPETCGGCGSEYACDLNHTDEHLCVYNETSELYECRVFSCDKDENTPATYNWEHCDSNHQNGCETDLLTNGSHCGACFDNCVFPSSFGSCQGGECIVSECWEGFGNCNGDGDDGCEETLDTWQNTCGWAEGEAVYIHRNNGGDSLRGDEGSDDSYFYSDWGNKWFRVFIVEGSDWPDSLSAGFYLDVPAGVNYEISLYNDNCTSFIKTSNGGVGANEHLCMSRSDSWGDDDGFWIFVKVTFTSGNNCTPWTLKVIGNESCD